MIRFGRSNKFSQFQRFDHKWHLEEFIDSIPQRSGLFSGKIRAYKDSVGTDEIIDISGFCKITHLLDAYKMIQGNYPLSQHPGLPSPNKRSAKVYSKIHDPHNQAYVDGVACYILSKFREAEHSPHFSLFYGAYLAIAKEYYYNITEDFPDIRFDSWFWKKQKEGVFNLVALNGNIPLKPDDPLIEVPEVLDSDDDSSSSSMSSAFSKFDEGDRLSNVSGGSLHSASISTASEQSNDSNDSKLFKLFESIRIDSAMIRFVDPPNH
jgi:hypothetical protein